MQIISILSPKGGAGKTTLSINIGRALKEDGYKVLLVDADAQQSLWDWAGAKEREKKKPLLKIIQVEKSVEKTLSETLLKNYDFIIIDGSPTIDKKIFETLKLTNVVLVPIRPGALDCWSTQDFFSSLKKVQETNFNRTKVAFILSQKKPRTKTSREMPKQLASFGFKVFEAGTCDRVAYSDSLWVGETVFEYHNNQKAKEEIINITNELKEFINE